MAILTHGRLEADPFAALADDAPPAAGAITVSLPRLLREAPALLAHGGPVGVRIAAGERIEDAAPHLPRLALVDVHFPKFRDGRGFTTARSLRERFGYAGQVRATGPLIPDQYVFLLRAGFDAVTLPEGADPAPWLAALAAHDVAYQPGYGGDAPLSHLRRRIAPGR